MFEKEGYTTKISEVEGTCVVFDCKELSHVVFSELGKEECDITSRNIGHVTGFMLRHPELTDVFVGPCTTKHRDKKNMAHIRLSGHFFEKGGEECGCDLLPANKKCALHEENSWEGTEAIFECHRFQKQDKDRIVTINKP